MREHAPIWPSAADGKGPRLRTPGRPKSLTAVCVQQLTDAIEGHVYEPGAQLPSEAELAAQLGVSRATLREALRTLEDHGLIMRRHGLGTFVSEKAIEKDLHRNFGITAMIRAAGFQAMTRDHRVEHMPASGRVAEALGLEPGTPVTVLSRVRLADTRPVVFSEDVIPAGLLGSEDWTALQDGGVSLYGVLYRHGVVINRGRAELVPMNASASVARKLGQRAGAALMCIKQVDFAVNGKPVVYSVEYHIADWVRFVVERVGPGREAECD